MFLSQIHEGRLANFFQSLLQEKSILQKESYTTQFIDSHPLILIFS